MGLFSQAKMDEINAIAEKSKEVLKPIKVSKSVTSSQQEIQQSTKAVLEYFKDSPAILITSKAQLHEYVLKAIESGYCGIDTETTGLDRTHDTIVGASLYYPGGVECYIPCKHLAPVFEVPYENQLSYEDVGSELQLFVDAKTKMILANADFDIAMVYKDFKVDLIPVCYYDVISAWRCIKEDEEDNRLKALYMKYVKKGKGDPKSFSDFFNPKLFPYCQPEVAKLYAANDAKITYELFMWQLPLVTKTHPRCQKRHLEKIADLWWNIELPMIRVCALMHRTGVYFDKADNAILKEKYDKQYALELKKLAEIVQEIMDNSDAITVSKSPFKNGAAFNEASSLQVKYLLNNFLHCNVDSGNKETLKELNLPVTNQILNVRAINKLLNTFIDKLPREVAKDGRIHSTFSSMGASTGRMCIAKGTKITCLNGLKNIEDIVSGDLVYCYDENGILQLKPVKNLWLTGRDRECVRVKWQSSGKGDVGELICTPEHLILKKDGTWCRADQLTRYTKVAHLRRTEPKSGERRPELYGWNGLCTREQDVVKYSIFHAESSKIIHHKDGDKTNNSLDNLEIMTNSAHCSYHTKELQKQGVLSYKSMQTPEARKKLAKTIRERHKQECINNKEYYLQLIKECNGRLTNIPYDFDSFKRNCAIAGIDIYAECAKYNSRYAWRTIPKETYIECYLRNDGSTTKIARELNISTQTAFTLREKYAKCLNHMVLKVEPAGTFDVYDIEVEDIHNFIANEICVHNSSANPNVQQIPSHALDIRHEFRATPAMEKIDSCIKSDNGLEITLGSYDSVTLDGDIQKDVIDLSVGDAVVSTKGSLRVRDIRHTLPNTTLLFDSTSDADSIKHITPAYVMMSSDFSQQEPKLTAYVSNDPKMIDAFKHNKDIYSTIASLAFHKSYEDCLEFFVDENGNKTDEVNREGKERRGSAKSIVLGILYGRSTKTIGDQLFGGNKQMTDDEKTAEAQSIYDAVLTAFPNLKALMLKAQGDARKYGYVETILGRRRHIPAMQLKPFEFKAASGYVNPDVDPLDPSTLQNKNEIPERIVKQLEKEFASYKYYGMIVKATKRLAEDHIRVINNSRQITDASRQCVNCVDYETEILTTSGWKTYDTVSEGDKILAYSLDSHTIVFDTVLNVHNYPRDTEVVRFESPTFSAVSTMEHRWVVGDHDEVPRIKQTKNIWKNKWPDYPILRIADNSFDDNLEYSDDMLKLLGWVVTDGYREHNRYGLSLYQSTSKSKNKQVYEDMISTLNRLNIDITDYSKDGIYHEIYLKKNDITSMLYANFPERELTFDFVSTLSQRQALILMHSMLQGDGSGVDGLGEFSINSRVSLICNSISSRDVFQYLCFVAGYATNSYEIDPTLHDSPSNHTLYESMGNIPKSTKKYYDVCVLRVQRAQIYPHHKSIEHTEGVWCVTTSTGTWIARRAGKVYITGNSIIQGSAADLTKMAMLKVFNNEEWNQLGARVLLPVHDELIAEVPIRNAERAAEILGTMMSSAGSFLPFSISCDVDITHKWYGLSYPCQYEKPDVLSCETHFSSLPENQIKWIQYHLFECEYTLPVYKDKDGKKPLGDAALGVNGVWSQETEDALNDYLSRYRISLDEFVDNIFHRVNGDVLK